ncbi:MAG: hypothetical protein IKV59_07170 [Lachnospiraceae bacterium]|nr:hypothetical protein [Lachnospiraceae bacterium]
MGYSDQEKLQEFEHLKAEFDDMNLICEVLPKGHLFDDITLLVCLPSTSWQEEDTGEELTEEDVHMASGVLLDMDDSDNRLAKYLVFYTQIRMDMTGLDELTVLRIVNALNRTSRVGHYFYSVVEGQDGALVQYRATVTGEDGVPLDAGVVADTIIEMGVGYELMKQALSEAQNGTFRVG